MAQTQESRERAAAEDRRAPAELKASARWGTGSGGEDAA